MNVTRTHRSIVTALLLSTAASSFAVSLGRLRGATIVGRPFDAILTAQLSGSEGLLSLCVEADVFFGESQVVPNKVRTTVMAGPNPGEALIRIQASSLVDEPVVTVVVREGCQQKNTRKYVVLADALSDSNSQASGFTSETAPSLPVQLPQAAGAGGQAGGAAANVGTPPATRGGNNGRARARTATPGSAPIATAAKPAASPQLPAAQPSLSPTKRMAEPAKPARSRLKLDPVDLGVERDPVLRGSMELLSSPTGDAQQRANAAALWQALNAQPQDVLRNNERLKALEADVAKVLAQSRKTDVAVSALQGELEQARGERYSNWLVYLLGGLTALLLLLSFFLWSRRRNSEAEQELWWKNEPRGPAEPGAEELALDDTDAALTPSKRAALWKRAIKPAEKPDVDFDLGESDVARPAAKSAAPAYDSTVNLKRMSSFGHSGFSHSLTSVGGAARVVNAEELFDVQQQSDFFLSLGNADKAVEVLRQHIAENPGTSAVAYLDLFDIFYEHSRKSDYEALRKEFNGLFNGQVPAFDDYTADTGGLEFYAAALSRIESLWPKPKVLDVIEESIFRKPDSGADAFSLTAYRELLMLHAVAKRILENPGEFASAEPEPYMDSAFPEYGHTEIHPLSSQFREAGSSVRPIAPDWDPTRPPASARIGLDIDLTAVPAIEVDLADTQLEPQQEATLPPIDAPAAEAKDLNMIEFELDPLDSLPPRKI